MALRDRFTTRPPAAILDVDGTLVDSNDAHADAWVDAFVEAGVQVDRERVRRAIGMGGDKLMPRVSGIAEQSPEGARISARRAEIFTSRYLPHIQPFPRVRELVERLRADGFTVVVASSAKARDLRGLLDRAGVADLVEERTSSDDAEQSKPDPDIVRAALTRSGATPDRAVLIGDTPYDVEAARRTGIAVIGVESGGWRRDELQGAAEVYTSPADLYDRYGQSVLGRLGRQMRRERSAATSFDVTTLVLVAAGLATAALIAVTLRALARRRSPIDEDRPVHERRAGLGPRDRQRLRHLIERTF